MPRPRRRLDRLVLIAYPRSFRRDYGDEVTRTIDDLRRHSGVRGWRLGLRVTGDVLATAPRLRLESAMNRTRTLPILIVVALVVLAAVAAMVVGHLGVVLVPIVLVGAATVIAARQDRPLATDPARSNRWVTWAVGGVLAIVASVVIAQVAGEDASEPVWALWAFTALAGLTMLAVALVAGANRLLHRRPAA